jgi:hypothetical protein
MGQKRLSVPILPEVDALIDGLSQITRTSKSRILTSLQTESADRLKLKYLIARHLQARGFKIRLGEKMGAERPDMIGQFGGKTVLIECLTTPTEAVCVDKVSKYSKYADELIFVVPKDQFDRGVFVGLGVKVFLCDLAGERVEKILHFDFDSEAFGEKKNRHKLTLVSFRTTRRLIDSIRQVVKEGLYRNETEVINEALRAFLKEYHRLNTNLMAKRVRKR